MTPEVPVPELSLDSVPYILLGELREKCGYAGVRLVDVRSPEEYADDHIPGAIPVPLFSDFERKVVGAQ